MTKIAADDLIPDLDILGAVRKSGHAAEGAGEEGAGENVRAVLRSLEMFSEFSDPELDVIAGHFGLARFEKNKSVFLEGDPGTSLFIICRGKVLVRKRDFSGQGVEMATLAKGRVFGEMAVIDGGQRSATCQSLDDSLMLTIDKTSFDRLVAETPALGVKLMRIIARSLSERLRTADGRLTDQHF